MALDQEGLVLLSFHLYDSKGALVAESRGLEHFPDGVTVRCGAGEVLLAVPADNNEPIRYRLYNCHGSLLTWSDGGRTKIYPFLRMGGRNQRDSRSG